MDRLYANDGLYRSVLGGKYSEKKERVMSSKTKMSAKKLRKIKNEQPKLTMDSLLRLIASHPDVDFYDLEEKQIRAVIKAYSQVVNDGIKVGVRVPILDIGEMYLFEKVYKGGWNYFVDPPVKIPPHKTNTIKFDISKALKKDVELLHKQFIDNQEDQIETEVEDNE